MPKTAASIILGASLALSAPCNPCTLAEPPAQPDGKGGMGTPTGPKVQTLKALGLAYTSLSRGADFAVAAAEKADAEKLAGVASLFRAMARVQQIHAGLMNAQIAALGGAAAIDPESKPIPVGQTAANLASALKILSALKETDLPAWRRACDDEGNRDAVRAIRWAREGTIELARFFKDAGPAGEALKGGKHDYYISRTCGFIVEKLDIQKCPVCGKGPDDFQKVN